jgi:5-methylcytosine-specific restriction enzyme A
VKNGENTAANELSGKIVDSATYSKDDHFSSMIKQMKIMRFSLQMGKSFSFLPKPKSKQLRASSSHPQMPFFLRDGDGGMTIYKKTHPFYNSSTWRKARERTLTHDHYLCQHCLQKGVLTPAEVVHHIHHLQDHSEQALDESNLQSVCAVCHNRLHPEKGKRVQPSKQKKARVIRSDANSEVR